MVKMALLSSFGLAAAYHTGPIASRPAVARAAICRMQEDDLRAFLLSKADVSEKFVDRVIELCDEVKQM